MLDQKVVRELAKENGWRAASFAEAYENRDVESYPPEDSEITFPWYGENFPDDYREAYRDGWQKFVDETSDSNIEVENESPWVYDADPRER